MNLLILSANRNLYSTRRLVTAAEERGHTVKVMNVRKSYAVLAKGELDIYYGDHKIENVDAVIPRIGASLTVYGSSMLRQFEMKHIFTPVSSLALVRSRDKLRALQILAKEGVAIPKTAVAKQPTDIESLIKIVGGAPLVVKLLEGTQGKGVVLAESKTAAKSVIEAFYGLNANILVQEFIKEAKGADVRAIVVGNKVVAAYKRQGKEGEFRSNLHSGGHGLPIKLKAAEKKAAIQAAQALGLKVAGVDLLQSDRGPLILEVNSSPGLEGVERTTGIDVAGAIIEFIEENYQASKLKNRDRIGA
jgi:ribosomal protein S6--L-glutamate ligase